MTPALDVFTRDTSMAAEHRRLMDGGHRTIAWEETTAATLSPELREGLADLWRARMLSEHRSIGVFALYVQDLLGAGAPAEILSVACRAALDEVRHAELFARLAAIYSGHEETPAGGIAAMADDPSVSMRDQVAREALHLSVFAETYSAVLLSDLHDRARDPVVKSVLGVVIADEVHHARMGWSFLASMLRGEDGAEIRARLQREVLGTMDGLVQSMFGDPSTIPASSLRDGERAIAEAHGYMAARDEYALFLRSIADIWIPGLADLGVDASALALRYPVAGVPT